MAQFPSSSFPTEAPAVASPPRPPASAALACRQQGVALSIRTAEPEIPASPVGVAAVPSSVADSVLTTSSPGALTSGAVCSRCGGSGRLRINDESFRTCLDCLGQGVLHRFTGQASLADWIAPATLPTV